MKEYVVPFVYLFLEMAPYLLLGFLIAGILHAFVPQDLYRKWLSGNDFKSVFLSLLFGIPLPLCSCGVIPTAVSMRKEGASAGATTGFLISTPQTGVDSIAATYSVMGLPFAVLRPLVALVTGLFGGLASNIVAKGETAEIKDVEADSCCCCGEESEDKSFIGRCKSAFDYAFTEMLEDIGKWLIVGLVLAGLVTVFVPDGFFTRFLDNPFLSMLAVLVIAVPMYVCATGSIPIAAALMLKGLSPGAALVFLMAGPATNIASMMVLGKTLGRRHLLVYLTSIIAGAISFGLAVDLLLPREWFTADLMSTYHSTCCAEEGSAIPWWQIASAVLLAILLIRVFILRRLGRTHGDGEDSSSSVRTERFLVKGMMCNHCREHVEKAIREVPGVTSVHVDLSSGEATVEGEYSCAAVVEAVRATGYECSEI